MRLLARIEEWLREKKVFERERTSTKKRALGILLYFGGLSCWKTGDALGVSQEAVRDWFEKGRAFFHTLPTRVRKRIAVDEKVFHLPGGTAYLWAAVDLDTGECLAVHVSTTRANLDAFFFMKKVKRVCLGRLPHVFVDGGEWYPWAFERLGFDRYNVVHWGPRAAIERYFSPMDRRYRVFMEYFPHGSTLGSLLRWGEALGGIHNLRLGLT